MSSDNEMRTVCVSFLCRSDPRSLMRYDAAGSAAARVCLGRGKTTYESARCSLLRWKMHEGSNWARIFLGRRSKEANSQVELFAQCLSLLSTFEVHISVAICGNCRRLNVGARSLGLRVVREKPNTAHSVSSPPKHLGECGATFRLLRHVPSDVSPFPLVYSTGLFCGRSRW